MLVADCWPDSPDDFVLPQTWEYQANAKLIAAAPNMLDALIKIRDWWTETTGNPEEIPFEVFDAMMDAIRRAQ